MRTGHEHKHPLEEGLEHINPIKGQLLKILAQPMGRGNPLVGTQHPTRLAGRRSRLSAGIEQAGIARGGATPTRNASTAPRSSGGAQPETQEHSTPDNE
jgi:hypothetical protein